MALYQSGSGLGALVGVGTTNPTSNLQVYGTPIATGNVFSVLNTAASGNVAQFSSSSGTALIINANGNVGIGKTNPGTLLDVNGALAATTIACSSVTAQGLAADGAVYLAGRAIEIGQGQTSDTASLIDLHSAEGTYPDFTFRIVRNGGANAPVYWVNRGSGNSYFQNQDSGSFYFQSGGLDIGAITSTGAIYFGKSYTATTGTRPGTNYVLSYDCSTPATPTASATYYGQNVAFTGGTLNGRMWNNSGAPSFYAADTFLQGTNCYDGTNNGTGASSQFAGNLYLDGGLSWCLGGSGTTNQCYAGGIYFRTGLSGGGLTTGTPTNRMVIMPNTGYVGIGTNNPAYILDVSGQSRIGNPALITDASTVLRMTTSGGASYFQTGTALTSGSVGDTVFTGIYGNPELMRIKSTGNVGIGTASPGALFQVNASVINPTVPTVHIGDNSNDYGSTYGMVHLTRSATPGDTKAHLSMIRNGSTGVNFGFYNNTNTFGIWASLGNTGTTPSISIPAAGRVGINNAAPQAQTMLEVNTCSSTYAQQTAFAASNTSGWIAASFGSSTGGDRVVIGTLNGIAHIGCHNAALNAWGNLSLQQGGNSVGIGTSNPGSILNVYSTVASPSSSIVTIGNVTTGYGAGNGDQTSVSCLYTSLGNGNNIVHQIGRTNDTNSFFYGYQHNTGSPWWWVAKYGVTNQSFTVNANGVGIGCTHTNTAFKMQVSNGDSSSTLYGPNGTWGAYLNVGTGSTYGSTNRASVNCSNGNLHIDCATGAYQIYLNYFQGGGNGGVNATIGCYGAVVATGDITAFSSDERLKTKVGLIENALDKVCSLTAFKYIHNDVARANGFTDDKVYVGLSAQEVQKVLPEVVKPAPFDQGTEYDVGLGKSKSGENYLTIQYERIVSLLVESIKEERKAREALEQRIKLLEQK